MRSWLRRWRPLATEPPTASHPDTAVVAPTPYVVPEVSWAEARWVVGVLSGNDAKCVELIETAESDWFGYVNQLEADGAWIRRVEVGRPSPNDAAAELLDHKGFVRVLDWKSPAGEVIGHYNACMRVHGLPPLSADETAHLCSLAPVDERQDDLFFPDLAAPLDAHAAAVGRRLVGCDEGGDSYGFAIVTDFAHRQLVDHWYVWDFYDVGKRFQRHD